MENSTARFPSGRERQHERTMILVYCSSINRAARYCTTSFAKSGVSLLTAVFFSCFFLQGGNLLLLDEPTNDLDVDTLRALEEAIDAYPGCAVIVSHDRYFLDRVATHTLAFEDDGGVVSLGGFDGKERGGGGNDGNPSAVVGSAVCCLVCGVGWGGDRARSAPARVAPP